MFLANRAGRRAAAKSATSSLNSDSAALPARTMNGEDRDRKGLPDVARSSGLGTMRHGPAPAPPRRGAA